ncbi:MAG: class I SAM-dependent methyltransferase [Pseudomonadota bacterium]
MARQADPWRVRLRRLGFALQTALGRPRGFFSPYRYAASVAPPVGYPVLQARFVEAFGAPATGGMAVPADVAAAITGFADDLAALAGPAPAPRWAQTWYPGLDGAVAYAVIRSLTPARVIEVGSGHSTRFMARAFADAGIAEARSTCIDPAPRAALGGLPVTWQRRLLSASDVEVFARLAPGDVAFFDSSHLLWPGSDVDLMVNAILPSLAPGVLVHFHDILLPDPYPPAWAWRGYTEQLALSGWLVGGAADLLWSSHYARHHHGIDAAGPLSAIPVHEGAPETALWLIRR